MPATTGQVLTWNTALAAPLQLAWADSSAALYAPTIVSPEGQTGSAGTTTEVSGETRCVYLCRAARAYSSAKIRYEVTTGGQAMAWGEVALFSGTPGIGAASNMKLLGYSNEAANFAGVGTYTASVAASIAAGTHLWVAWAAKSEAVMPSFRCFIADSLLSGISEYCAATQPSTMADDTAFAVFGASTVPMRCLVQLVP